MRTPRIELPPGNTHTLPDHNTPPTPSPQPRAALTTPLLTALFLAAAACTLHAILPPETARAVAAVVIGALGGVYLGGALRTHSTPDIITSAIAALICVALGAAGLLGPAWIIPAAFILHGLWDWTHHALDRRTVGHWWPSFCALFDFIFGAYLFTQYTA